MKTYITINGKKATITERKNMEAARQSAINICDHSKEIIVREVDEITDYTKVFENNPVYYTQMQGIIDEVVDKYGKDPLIQQFGKAFINELKRLEGF
jgi:hypothetical protein